MSKLSLLHSKKKKKKMVIGLLVIGVLGQGWGVHDAERVSDTACPRWPPEYNRILEECIPYFYYVNV